MAVWASYLDAVDTVPGVHRVADMLPPETMLSKDFFISYTAADETIAEWIAFCLEDNGYEVIFQKWDIRPGHNFVMLMQQAAAYAKRTILILSPDYEAAVFTQPEWAAAFESDPTGSQRKVQPVRVFDFRPSGLLRSIVYIDLVPHLINEDREAARAALLEGVREGRAKPKHEPSFPCYRGKVEEGQE